MLDVEMEIASGGDKAASSSSRAHQSNQLQLRIEQASPSTLTDSQIYLALDTNVLISHLELVKKVYTRLKEVPTLPTPKSTKTQAKSLDGLRGDPLKGGVCLLLPYVVLDELDGLNLKHFKKGHAGASAKENLIGGSERLNHNGKSKSPPGVSSESKDSLALSMHNPNKSRKGSRPQVDLSQSARDAISWLFETLKREDATTKKKNKGKVEHDVDGQSTRTIRFQKRDEKMGVGILELPSKADTQIMDCCRFFSSAFQGSHRVVLWTGDKHLRLQAEVHDIPTIGDGQKTFSRVLDHVVERLTPSGDVLVTQVKDQPAGPESIHQPNATASKKAKVKVKEKPPLKKETESVSEEKTDAELESSNRTVRNIDNQLSQIIPLQLYSFLLERLYHRKPVELRAFLTAEDPGPGAWDVRHCLHLVKKSWPGLSAILPQDRIAATSDAIIWLEAFLEWYSDPTRESVYPGSKPLSQIEQDEMHIEDDGMTARDDSTIRRDWEQAKEAIVLIFRPYLDETACIQVEKVLQWMTSG